MQKVTLKIGDTEISLENIEILHLNEDDVLVVHLDTHLSHQDSMDIHAVFTTLVGEKNKVVVLPKGFTLEGVNQYDIPAKTLQAGKKYRLTTRHGFTEMEEYDVRL